MPVLPILELQIEVVSVTGLPDLSRPIDRGYVSCRVMHVDRKQQLGDVSRTKEEQAQNSSLLYRNQTHTMKVFALDNLIRFQVWNRRLLAPNDLFGGVEFPISSLIRDYGDLEFNKQITASFPLGNPCPDDRLVPQISGELQIRVIPLRAPPIRSFLWGLAADGKKYFSLELTWEITTLQIFGRTTGRQEFTKVIAENLDNRVSEFSLLTSDAVESLGCQMIAQKGGTCVDLPREFTKELVQKLWNIWLLDVYRNSFIPNPALCAWDFYLDSTKTTSVYSIATKEGAKYTSAELCNQYTQAEIYTSASRSLDTKVWTTWQDILG